MLLGLVLATSGTAEVLGRPMPEAAPRCCRRSVRWSRGRRRTRGCPGRANLALLRRARRRAARRSRRAGSTTCSTGSGSAGSTSGRCAAYSPRHAAAARARRRPARASRGCWSSTSRPTASTRRASARSASCCSSSTRAGTTVFLSSHLLAEVEQMCTRVGVLDRGRLVVQDQLDVLQRPDRPHATSARPTSRGRGRCSTGRSRRYDASSLLVRVPDVAALNAAAGAAAGYGSASSRPSGTRSRTSCSRPRPRAATGSSDRRERGGDRGSSCTKLVRSRRTWVTILLIDALPTLVAVLLAVTDIGPRPGTGPAFLSAVLTDGTLFPLAAMAIVLPLFLPIAVAVHGRRRDRRRGPAGHAALPAGPAGRPDPAAGGQAGQRDGVRAADARGRRRDGVRRRRRCCSATATIGADHHASPARRSSQQQLIGRTFLALGYAMLCMLGVAAIALFLSTVVDTPLGAALGTMAVLVASTLLLTLDAADSIAALPADPLLAGLRRPVPRPDPLARRGARRRCCRARTCGVPRRRLGQLRDQGHQGLTPVAGEPSADLRPGYGGRPPAGRARGVTAGDRPTGVRGRSPWLTSSAGADRLDGEVEGAVEVGGRRRHHDLVVGRPDRDPQRAGGRLVAGVELAEQLAVGQQLLARLGARVRGDVGAEPGQVGAVVRRADGDDAAGQAVAAVVARPRGGRRRRRRSSPTTSTDRAPSRCIWRTTALSSARACSSRSPVLSPGRSTITTDRPCDRSASASTSSAVVPPL